MNVVTHFIISLDILLLFDHPLWKAALFSLLFAVLIDVDVLVGRMMGKPNHHSRSWVQEPLSLLLIALPIAFILSYFIKDAYTLVFVPYASHIVLDYVTINEVSPLAPIKKKNVDVGFIRPIGSRKRGVSEWWIFVPAFAFMLGLLA